MSSDARWLGGLWLDVERSRCCRENVSGDESGMWEAADGAANWRELRVEYQPFVQRTFCRRNT